MVLRNFIVLEGIDGAGTSTQIKALSQRNNADQFFLTAEPTNGPTGIFLRKMLKGEITLNPITTAYLFAADRAEHMWGQSAPNGNIVQMAQRKLVISDRYFFSSLAYQSIDCGFEIPNTINRFFPLPELLFFFDIEPRISLQRIQEREFTEIYEKLDFLEKTATAYRSIINEYDGTEKGKGMKIIRIDATQSPDSISSIIWNNIKDMQILHI
jgi:dTMP kinase